jgi:hypothetical protein
MPNHVEYPDATEWRIRGYDSLTPTMSLDVPFEKLSRDHVYQLLQMLVARSLTEQEIIDAALGQNSLLEVRVDEHPERGPVMMAGANPHFVAGMFPAGERA